MRHWSFNFFDYETGCLQCFLFGKQNNGTKAVSFCFISESLGDFPIDAFGKGGNYAISQDYVPDMKYIDAKLISLFHC